MASLVREYVPPDYEADHGLVPHGMSVVLGSPAAFRFTASTAPERHLRAAEMMGCDVSQARSEDGGELIARKLIEWMRAFELPNGLGDVGFLEEDIPALVEGAMKQERLLVLSPRPVTVHDMTRVFCEAMHYGGSEG